MKLIDPAYGIRGPDGWECHITAHGPLAWVIWLLQWKGLLRWRVVFMQTTASTDATYLEIRRKL